MKFQGTPSEIIRFFLHHSLEQMFQQDHVYHQLSEYGTTLTKVLKTSQQYHLSSIIYKPLLFKKYNYLATTHLVKCICLYFMPELEILVTEDGDFNKYRNEHHQLFVIARDFQQLSNILHVLYSNITLDFQLNINLFSAVHEYMKNTKRFDNILAHSPFIRTLKCYYITAVFSTIPLYIAFACIADLLLGTGGSILTMKTCK